MIKSAFDYDTTNVNKTILTEIIKLFVVKEKQKRFLEFIESKKRYDDFLHEFLNDSRNLRKDCIIEIPSNQQTPELIAAQLYKSSAKKKSYLVSSNDEIDGKVGNLEELLNLISMEGFVYCLETRLAYYEGHHSWRYILNANNFQ
jgi:hypothetical protein